MKTLITSDASVMETLAAGKSIALPNGHVFVGTSRGIDKLTNNDWDEIRSYYGSGNIAICNDASSNAPEIAALPTTVFVRIGNAGDAGQYAGEVVQCNIIAINRYLINNDKNRAQLQVMVSPIDNPTYYGKAIYAPHMLFKTTFYCIHTVERENVDAALDALWFDGDEIVKTAIYTDRKLA